MLSSRFARENLNPKLATGEIGDAFQHFVYEVLSPDYADLHQFPTAGKDGGIDLSQTGDTFRVVFECKFIGNDDLKTALGRWKIVADNLRRNICDPGGPKESQYSPWYKTTPPITEYHFCVSSELKNQDNFDQLPAEISKFFKELGAAHPHLTHLANITVKVTDWSDLRRLLGQRPHLLFRWFPRTRPQGLLTLADSPDFGTFKAYLSNTTLPYYSRSEHMRAMPTGGRYVTRELY
jgi:hypothetical protein